MIPALSPETLLAIAVVVAAFTAAHFRAVWLGWWERPLARLARRKKLAILASAAAPLILRAVLLPWHPAPEPRVHDEFTLLLGADTFAHGRLVNPQHPFWVHFESMHLLTRPVYASAFPVAQSIVLALGKVVFGHPWAGVWMGVAFMCGAICWMLQGWLPPRWALLGALLAALKWGVSSYWMNSYWGGSLAAVGGALALGALPRMTRVPHWGHAVMLGAGLAILANSRPFEGAVFGLTIAVPLLVRRTFWSWAPSGHSLRASLLPIVLVLAVAALAMGYYFWRVTGTPWRLPYVQYRNTLSVAPHFIWQTPTPPPLYNNFEMRHFFVDQEMFDYRSAHSFREATNKLNKYWRFYIGPVLTLPLLALPFLFRDRRTRVLVWMAAAFVLALPVQVWQYAHYAAPATGLLILIAIGSLRRLRLWRWRGRAVGLAMGRSVPVAIAAMLLIQIAAGPGSQAAGASLVSWRWAWFSGESRAQVLRDLQSTPGKHLVLVRYNQVHDPGDEWVYNDAGIDASKVVWARELDPLSNQKLMRYYSDRRVWLIEPDLPVPHVVSYKDVPFRPMPFVALGAPGIEILRSPEEVKEKVRARASGLLTCDQWNYYFTAATGVAAPYASPTANQECYGGDDRTKPVPFEQWFEWLKRQH